MTCDRTALVRRVGRIATAAAVMLTFGQSALVLHVAAFIAGPSVAPRASADRRLPS
jgi:hypothetical protein